MRIAAQTSRLLGAFRRGVWWGLDYAYVSYWQLAGWWHPGAADQFESPERPVAPSLVLIPGVYESWRFMRPLALRLYRSGHPVHLVPALGFNAGSIPEMARRVTDYLEERDLTDVVIIAHSKGGLIGKYAMLRDEQLRIRAMVAVNSPFAGSRYARWIPVAGVRAFAPTDVVLAALAADLSVNARITSAASRFDPHIPGGSTLPGATNTVLATPGHFRALHDRELVPLILGTIRASSDG